MAVLGIEFFNCCFNKPVIKTVFNQVYSTAAKAAAHYTRPCYTTLTGNVVKEVEFLTRNLV